MTFLRDQLAAIKINRIKRRIAASWAARKPCECAVCTGRLSAGATPILDAMRRALADDTERTGLGDETPAPGAPKH